VPGCKRTTPYECKSLEIDGRTVHLECEWLCARHWPTVPRDIRRRHISAKRQWTKHKTLALLEQEKMAWEQCVNAAVEIEVGIG
jgi:hypothetical protein